MTTRTRFISNQLISSSQSGPIARAGYGVVDSFVARTQRMFVEHVTLEPNLRVERGADCQRAAQGTSIDEDLEFDAFQIEMNPEELATGKRISQRLEGNDSTGETPVVFVCGASRRGFFEGQPACLSFAATHARAIGKTAKTNVQLLRAESGWTNLG